MVSYPTLTISFFISFTLIINQSLCKDNQVWQKIESATQDYVIRTVDHIENSINLELSGVSSKCHFSIRNYTRKLKKLDLDAIKSK